MAEKSSVKLEKIDEVRFRIPRSGKMNTDGLVFASEKMLKKIYEDKSLDQVVNVACLPGIVGSSMAMPDIHWGYGFPIGGVAAFSAGDGIISPGGVGYDINCGVRLLRTELTRNLVKNKIKEIVSQLFYDIPSGVGSSRKDLSLSYNQLDSVMKEGAGWAVANGFGTPDDLRHIEANGCIDGADPDMVSDKARKRGRNQLGTLGSGNHFVEVGYVDEIYDEKAANAMGLFMNGVTIFIHTGSRGLGHQVCDDYIRIMLNAARKYGIYLPDKQLCCAPFNSEEGKRYYRAMNAAANFAFCNRQIITHWVRESLQSVLNMSPKHLGLELVYDVAHNIAKLERHTVNGKKQMVIVHRKGATRAFPPGHPELPGDYSEIGQPVLIPGDMGRYSYVLVGTSAAMDETFGSTCHGAGRLLGRGAALRQARGRDIRKELAESGIYIKATGNKTIYEEMPEAYKNVLDVVDVVHRAGISKKVARLIPMGVMKG
ncbi:MAG: RtcB family protein [Candidatus Eremiobacteraeota bacterium]|nr:RtcB family protein [Candidatus Eremiobacteraeota bacterium]